MVDGLTFPQNHIPCIFFPSPTFTMTSKDLDSEHPTQDPFTSAGQSTGTGCHCCFWVVPLAALGGCMYEIFRKIGNCFKSDSA
jgi:hypothetical protein